MKTMISKDLQQFKEGDRIAYTKLHVPGDFTGTFLRLEAQDRYLLVRSAGGEVLWHSVPHLESVKLEQDEDDF
jgi:hypothetical protein